MSLKQMLRTLDSEELTLQMAYDLIEQEEVEASRRAAGLTGALPPPPPMPRAAARRPTAEEFAAYLDRLWGKPDHG